MRFHQVGAVLPLAALLSVAGACQQKDGTALVVTVWSDFLVPTEMDSIRINVVGQEREIDHPFQLADEAELGKHTLPVRLALVPAGAQDLSIAITAIGSRGQTEMVWQKAVLAFIPGQARELDLFLAKDCTNITCEDLPAYTCDRGACTKPVQVDTRTLPFFNPRRDASWPYSGSPPATVDSAAVEAGSVPSIDGRTTPASVDGGVGGDGVADTQRFDIFGQGGLDVPLGGAGGITVTGGASGMGGIGGMQGRYHGAF